MASRQFDPAKLEILWSGLTSIAEEMGVTLKRTAYSEMVREANDFSCALFDSTGRMIAQTDYIGSPGHLGSVRNAVKIMVREYPPESMKPGDSLITNDPYLVAGHLPDFAIATPVFFDNRLVAFALNITHHSDIGGKAAGGHIADSREIFEEGLRVPVVKFYSGGVPNKDIIRLIESNVRIPHKELGDFNAQLSSNFVGSKRLVEFMNDFRLSFQDFGMLCGKIIESAEVAMRESIKTIPSGVYKAEELMESFDGDSSIPLKATVTVESEKLVVDYNGTGKQSQNGMNSPYNYTFAYTSHAVKCVTNPRVPMNEGVMGTIDVRAPEGSILNPKFPAAVGGRHLTNWHVNSLVFKALAKAIPSRVIAPSGGTGSNQPQFSGVDMRTGKPFIQIVNHSGGLGARPTKDGIHCYPFPARAENTAVEIVETVAPLSIRKLELVTDSGGPGKFRGGCGVVMEVRIDSEEITLLNVSGRDHFPADGLLGGLEANKSQILLKERRKRQFARLHPRKIVHVHRGDLLRFVLPGGGGYGSPLQRNPEYVLEDVREGIVSIKAAASIYGVSIDPADFSLNRKKTSELRRRKPRGMTVRAG